MDDRELSLAAYLEARYGGPEAAPDPSPETCACGHDEGWHPAHLGDVDAPCKHPGCACEDYR